MCSGCKLGWSSSFTSVVTLLGVFALAWAEAESEVAYETDYSTDRGWVTDQPASYHWNLAAATCHARVGNNAPGYRPNCCFYRGAAWSGDSFELEWDVKVSRTDWSGGVSFGIFDESIGIVANARTKAPGQ